MEARAGVEPTYTDLQYVSHQINQCFARKPTYPTYRRNAGRIILDAASCVNFFRNEGDQLTIAVFLDTNIANKIDQSPLAIDKRIRSRHYRYMQFAYAAHIPSIASSSPN